MWNRVLAIGEEEALASTVPTDTDVAETEGAP
jgi:hypothetical protein